MKRCTTAVIAIFLVSLLVLSAGSHARAQSAATALPLTHDTACRVAAEAECGLKIVPSSIRAGSFSRLAFILVSGITFEKGDVVDWGTDDVLTLFRIPTRRFILFIVWILGDPEPGEFQVSVGDDNCTTTLTLR